MDDELSQILPVSSNKIHCLSIYFEKDYKGISGIFSLILRLSGSNKVILRKEISFDNLKKGWNSFSLDQHILDREDVILTCKWTTTEDMDRVPAIGLSNAHWHPTYAVQGVHKALTARSVAMKIWSGLPGMQPPMIKDLGEVTEAHEPQIVALPPQALIEFRRAQFPEDNLSVRYLPDIARLEVHPSASGVVAAVSADAMPVGTSWVSADVRTINPEADPVEYAMLIARSDDDAISQLSQNDSIKGSFSGWQAVEPNSPARLTLIVNQAWHWDDRLYLATRLAPASRPEAAWATWGGIEYGINDQNQLVRSVLGMKSEMIDTGDGLNGNLERAPMDPILISKLSNRKASKPL